MNLLVLELARSGTHETEIDSIDAILLQEIFYFQYTVNCHPAGVGIKAL